MIFRTYDIRGVVGDTLTEDIAEQIGRAFGSEMLARGEGRVIVGRDNRLSSEGLADSLMAGIRTAGADTINIGEVATPVVYHASVTSDNTPAIMITGSHLPPDRNGFKMTLGTTPFFGDDIQNLKTRINQNDFASGKGTHSDDLETPTRYMADLAGRFETSEKEFTVVVDAGNGMAGAFAPTLVRYMGHKLIELYTLSDGTYPNHPADPFVEENLLDAQGVLLTKDADLAMVFDGDADRLGMIDHHGQVHSTDRLLIPLVLDVLRRHEGATIVTDPLVSSVLIETIKGAGGVPLMWKSGHSNIKTKMKEVNAPLALETSGHVFIADDYYGYDDGIYTGLRMLELLSRARTAPLAEIMATLPQLHTTPQYRPACAEDKKQKVIKAVGKAFNNEDINDVDGVRVSLKNGWFIIRASNTEPKLSLRFEATDEETLNTMRDKVTKILQKHNVDLMGDSGGH